MKCNWKKLATDVIASLSQQEREDSIAYIEQRVIPAGEFVSWAGIERSFDEAVIIAFVDMEPPLNWTHRGRYLIVAPEGGVREMVEVDRPPFLSEVSPHLRMVHLGEHAPQWAAVTTAELE